MEQMFEYVKTELIVLIPVLFFIGEGIKSSQIKNKFIPFILMAIGIVLSGLWVFGTTAVSGSQDVALAVFTSIVQGIIVAGMSTYIKELSKIKDADN